MNATREPTKVIVDCLRMNDRELAPMLVALARLDRTGVPGRTPVTNVAIPSERSTSNLPRVLVHLCQPDSTGCTTYLVKPRDLHEEGISFLHGAFVHNNARCTLLLRTANSEPTQIPARVINCRHVAGRIHELVAIFDQPVKLDEFQYPDGTPCGASR